jgi:glc operon protein GlcG
MTLSLAQAVQIIEGAIAKARQLGIKVSVVVCDANGRLIALNKMDGASAEANRGSIGKAVASATYGRPSGEGAGDDLSVRTATVIGEGSPIIRREGGLPIVRTGILEGACGVGGADDDRQDEDCAHELV